MWMARALLGNNGRCLMEECYCTLLGNREPIKTLARNHVTCFLCGLPYATIELCFLCVVRAEPV
jgi:fluoride ion exporter CrcB/FEX